MSLHSDIITPSPSAEEIDAALAAAQVHSDTIEFAEFLDIHRQMRWLRRNSAFRSSPDIARNTGSDALTRAGSAAKRAGSSGATKSRAGKVDESLDAEREALKTSKMMAEMARDEQQAAICCSFAIHLFCARLHGGGWRERRDERPSVFFPFRRSPVCFLFKERKKGSFFVY